MLAFSQNTNQQRERPIPMSTRTIEVEILQALQRRFGGNPRITDSLAGLGVDSLGMAELTTELENHFGIRMDEQILGIDTVDELADYVRTRATPSNSK